MNDVAIMVEDLRKSFGNVDAVRGVSFEIRTGAVVGFIGANGAGKTTTMRILSTLDWPDSGRLFIAGHDVLEKPGEVRARLGWMPDSFGVYENMTVTEYLDFFARSFGFKGVERNRRVREVMEFTEVLDLGERPVTGLSKGQAQRLCLARTLLPDPGVLILDEPAAGLDPKARIDFKRLVRLLAEEGKTLFISSHILSELEEMCDELLFIDEGRIVHHGTASSLKKANTKGLRVSVRVDGAPKPLLEWVLLQPGVTLQEELRDGAKIFLEDTDPATVATVVSRMVNAGIRVVEFRHEEVRLEDAFISMLGKVRDGGAA